MPDSAQTAQALWRENAALRAVARAAADYLGWQEGFIPDADHNAGHVQRGHLVALLKTACPEYLRGGKQ